MATTIQVHEKIKNELASLKSEGESYEAVIQRLIFAVENENRERTKLLIEGCKVMAKDSLQVCKDWEAANTSWPEWKE